MVDELLAMLEPRAIQFGMGRGGIPTLTPQDVAAALGFCTDKRAIQVYQGFVGDSTDRKNLDFIVATIQFEEWRNRADRLVDAQLAEAGARLTPPRVRPERIREAKLLLDGERAAMWPALHEETYGALRDTLINEMRRPKICMTCKGRKTYQVGELLVECLDCRGTGREAVSNRRRSAEMGIPHTSYQRCWGKVFDWTFRRVGDLIDDGREAFKKALGRITD